MSAHRQRIQALQGEDRAAFIAGFMNGITLHASYHIGEPAAKALLEYLGSELRAAPQPAPAPTT